MTQLKRIAAIVVWALLVWGCGGSGSPSVPPATDFVPFFASVFAQPAQPDDPVPLANRVFVNQFPADETTFDFLLD